MDIPALKSHCEALIGIRHDVKWDYVDVYSVHQTKMVCIFYDGDKMACKVPDDLFIMMAEIPGCRPAPHLARAGWIEFGKSCPLPTTELENIISQSWHLVVNKLPKYVQKVLRPNETER
ncbi:MmcQ/YjbR family DNA-binding protein [Enterovibrio sp. ZSDZ35]|uniref:MmcQ/YjbR family DNA-binding protein n=1 Tax=Enterovibrio qingdaonensis TaxID=2899818 RepID=A0ABT5QT53_9GAMM|nr:MmcQ/YjbR family DNA-binding protein [Enterovibrio sp. ZSDZ35]MDD1784161.1 MmcQ/YjbR family DNA-binding protein [Enterovibrio sp. ZSDZ35]